MTDFPFDKQYVREEQNICMIKEKLQSILETLENQKQQFIISYENKMMAYQQELKLKDSIIESLVQSLEIKNQKISQMKNESSNYLALIENLKAQIFKMASVVNNIKSPAPKSQLKRVKSDYIENPFTKVSINIQDMTSCGKRFDINSYFQNVKMKYPYQKQFVCYQKKSQLDDNLSSTETIKIKPQAYDSQVLRVLKNNEEKFKRTLKWIQQKRNKPKENLYTIKDYKQNFWQQSC